VSYKGYKAYKARRQAAGSQGQQPAANPEPPPNNQVPPPEAPNAPGKRTQIVFPKEGPYKDIPDLPNAGVKDFTPSQKAKIIEANKARNGGVVKSDISGMELTPPTKSQKGVTPSPTEWQIDHIKPIDQGGTNNYSNAQVISRSENRAKSNLSAP
jgi:hypothetical protein